MADTIGIMEGAFFVSKPELLSWINSTLSLNLTKVEQLGTGAVYCQILDACHPGEIPLHKVNFKAKLEYEFVNNFKVLQQGFDKFQITRHIEVEKLVKSRPLDNLEFAQWMKRYWEIKTGGKREYDAVGRRGKNEVDFGEKKDGKESKKVVQVPMKKIVGKENGLK
jgi:RP/EB family microtubule-associated protein